MHPSYDAEAARRVLSQNDPTLGMLIARVGPYQLTLRHMQSPFLGLLRAIVYQQLSGKAARTIHERVLALFPESEPRADVLLTLPDETLRGAGLSRNKTLAVKDLAVKTLDGTVPPADHLAELSDEEIIERLTAVRGIGRWTVEMLLIFNLGRPDVLPLDDLGIRKGFKITYDLDDLPRPAQLRAHGARWASYRSVASWYLWRAVDQVN